ncbi:unannotated protein [freshwater metagenome]|uniref:Unannotated protein n=1 Tax=freshwater metagenome TaxID=449393 RepID=A0A6J7VKY5_9ZZZZ
MTRRVSKGRSRRTGDRRDAGESEQQMLVAAFARPTGTGAHLELRRRVPLLRPWTAVHAKAALRVVPWSNATDQSHRYRFAIAYSTVRFGLHLLARSSPRIGA